METRLIQIYDYAEELPLESYELNPYFSELVECEPYDVYRAALCQSVAEMRELMADRIARGVGVTTEERAIYTDLVTRNRESPCQF